MSELPKMENISNVILSPLKESIYVKPYRMHFNQNGTACSWDLLGVHDSVAIVIYNITRNVLVLVKQYRPAVYFGSIPEEDRRPGTEIDVRKYPASLGVAIEFCAGIIDKDKPIKEIAKEEVLEECGYDVPLDSLKKISSYRSGVGHSAALQTAYYCEVTDDMRVSSGGGVDDEIIEVIEMTVDELKKYISTDPVQSPPSFMYLVYWFLFHVVQKHV